MFDALLDRIPADALLGAFGKIVEAQIAPLFEKVRAELLGRVTGEPPQTWRDRLIEKGFPVHDDATARALWQAFVAACADPQPFMATVDPATLHVPDPTSTVVEMPSA